MALTITKAYAAGSALTEAHIDNFRTGLHTFFNTDKISSASFDAGMALTSTKFTGSEMTAADNTFITFGTDSDATFGLDADKKMVFSTANSVCEIRFYAGTTYYLELYTDKIYIPGDVVIGAGGSSRTLLQALSSYKKPVLEWAGASYISIQQNSATTNETVLYFPTFVAAVTESTTSGSKYRQASITATANGYGTGDTGAAKGGRRSGVSLNTNSWYAVYAAKVRSGDDYDADTASFVLVFDTTLPTAANEADLDSYYGSGSWVYLGLIRYGLGATGDSSSIVRFKQSNKGWTYFYESVALEYSTSSSSNTASPFYTLATGVSGQVVPSTVGHVSIGVSRVEVSDWYIKDEAGKIVWRGGWQTDDSDIPHGFIVELPLQQYAFYQSVKGTRAVAKKVVLHGFSDGYMLLRRQGHGI